MKIRKVYLQKRKNFRLRFRYDDGSEKVITLQTQELSVAQLVLEKARKEIDLGILNLTNYITDKRKGLTLDKFFSLWLKERETDAKNGRISDKTLRNSQMSCGHFVKIVGNKPIDKITRTDIDKFMNHLNSSNTERYGKPFSKYSIISYKRHISPAFSYAQHKGWIEKNPFSFYKHAAIEREEVPNIRYLTEEEIHALRRYFLTRESEWMLDAMNLCLYTGLREGSVCTLKYEHIDGEYIRIPGMKRSKLRANVPLSKKAREILTRRKNMKFSTAGLRHGNYHPHEDRFLKGYVFWEVTRPDSISKTFRRAVIKIGLKDDVKFHSLRHTFATNYLNNGGRIETLQAILGHVNLQTTQIYAKVTDKMRAHNIDVYADI